MVWIRTVTPQQMLAVLADEENENCEEITIIDPLFESDGEPSDEAARDEATP